MSWLAGKKVAITGQMASMTRGNAIALILAHGGEFVPAVNLHTSVLLLGQKGWPLRKDGHLTQQLRAAEQMRRDGLMIDIVPEEEMLRRIGQNAEGIHRLYTLAQLVELLRVPRARARA